MKSPEMWLSGLNLLVADKKTLLDPVGWLNDSLINASQKLLKLQFPHINGLQSVALGHVMGFTIESGEFLQILHSVGNHWLAIYGTGHDVKVYDSMYNFIPDQIKAQIACLMCTKESKIPVSIMDVTRQVKLSSNVTAVAINITAIAFGLDPAVCVFDQHAMR